MTMDATKTTGHYMGLNRIELFAIDFLPHLLTHRVPAFHRRIYAGLTNGNFDRLVIETMRGGAKSTLSKIAALQWICEGDQPEYHLITQTGGSTGLSAKWMRDIRTELEQNDVLRLTYGITQGDSWGQDHIQVKRADGKVIDFYCRGKGCSIRGHRGNIIIDDIQDRDDCASEAILERDEAWLFSDVIPVLLEGQRLIFIGTPISPFSLLTKVKRIPDWTVLSFPAEEDGHSIWPEQYSDDFLARRRLEIGNDAYNAEYLCRPMVAENIIFRQEWLQSFELTPDKYQRLVSDDMYVIVAIDPAISQQDSADYTAIVTVGVTTDVNPMYYLLDAQRGHWTMGQTVERLGLVYDKYHQHKTVIETVAYQGALMEAVADYEHRYNVCLNTYGVKPDKDKIRRAFAVQPVFQQKRVYVDFTQRGQQQLVDELMMFTGDGRMHDDYVDALVYAIREGKDWSVGLKDKDINITVGGIYGN